MNKLDELTQRLSQQEPELTDAESFCDDIMDRLPEVGAEMLTPAAVNRNPRNNMQWIRLCQTLTSAAAIALAVIFMHQTYGTKPVEDLTFSTSSQLMQDAGTSLDQIRRSSDIHEAIALLNERERSRFAVAELKKQYTLTNY